ncbi:MAG: 50S ribosomal protein L25 [Planctomycetota bacterium]
MSTSPVALSAQPRERLGTRESRRLRRDGKLPAVVYGHGEEAQSVTLDLKEAGDAIKHGAHLFELKLDGGAQQVLVKDVQYDHLGIEMLHVDLFRVNLDEEITSEVAVVLTGDSKGVKAGGILTQMRDSIEVVCKVRDLPDELSANVADLDIGDALHVSQLTLPANVSLPPSDADFTIAMIAAPKLKGEDVAPADSSEPEIIGEKKDDDQPAGDAPADEKA